MSLTNYEVENIPKLISLFLKMSVKEREIFLTLGEGIHIGAQIYLEDYKKCQE